jgi:hypothetical protein
MIFFTILAFIKFVIIGAFWGRVDGGGIVKTSEWIERAGVMFGFLLACSTFAGLWSLVALIGVVGIATGHGNYFLNRNIKFLEPEKADYLLNLIFGKDPRTDRGVTVYSGVVRTNKLNALVEKYGLDKLYWRNVAGMFVTGLALGLPASILSLVFGEYFAAALFSLTGFAKAAAYMIGYKFFNKGDDEGTVSAEYINGALRNIICGIVILIAFL